MLFGNDSGNVELTRFNQLAKKFGVRFNGDSRNRVIGSQYEMGAFTIPANHYQITSTHHHYVPIDE